MKNQLILLIMVIISAACTTPSGEKENIITSEKSTFSARNFTGSTVAFEDKGILQLGVSDSELIKSFNTYSQKMDLGLKAHSYTIEEIGGGNYIRFYNVDESVSTIALLPKDSIADNVDSLVYRLGSTVCTTTECANCCGCVPKGDYCTRCGVDILDCKRTTSKEFPRGTN